MISLLNALPPQPGSVAWRHHWRTESGELTMSLADCGRGYMLRFPELADFVISKDACHVAAWPAPDADGETLQHLLLDQVLPRMLAHRGRLVLHASAVEAGGRAVAFAGETGFGKSTMAASLHQGGWPLLGDDAVIVATGDDGVTARPTYRGLRLWPASVAATVDHALSEAPMAHYSDKRRLAVPSTGDHPSRPALAALYVLAEPSESDGDDIRLTRFSTRDACLELIRHSFQLDVTHRELAGLLLAKASEVAARVPVFELSYPRDFERLPEVRTVLRDHLERLAGAQLPIEDRG